MKDLRISQLKFETETWHRVLSFLGEENAHLKNRLSSILQTDFDLHLMEGFEEFQNRFVSADAAIRAHKKALVELERSWSEDAMNHKFDWSELINGLSKIKDSIGHLHRSMFALIWDFNRYLEKELFVFRH